MKNIWFSTFTADDRLLQLWETDQERKRHFEIVEVHKRTLNPINTLHTSRSLDRIMDYWDRLTR